MGFGTNLLTFILGFGFVYFAVWNIHILLGVAFIFLIAILFFSEAKLVIYPIAGMIVAGLLQLYSLVSNIQIPFLG